MRNAFLAAFTGLTTLVAAMTNTHAATVTIVMDQDAVLGNANGTTLTLRFASSTDNQTVFSGADFYDRTWDNLDAFGPGNLTAIVGLFPESNLDNTDIIIAGSFDASGGSFNFGFSYSEVNTALGFSPIDFDRVSGNRLRGPALWTAIDGFFPNFYIDQIDYDGSASSFDATTPVPLPAAAALFPLGIGGLAALRRRRTTS